MCSSEVPDTDNWLETTYGDTEGFVALWSYDGAEGAARTWSQDAAIDAPVLVDEDGSLSAAYFIPDGDDAFAVNPRHYVIGADGTFAYVSTSASPGSLQDAVDAALADAGR